MEGEYRVIGVFLRLSAVMAGLVPAIHAVTFQP